jgi:hypothetical protein
MQTRGIDFIGILPQWLALSAIAVVALQHVNPLVSAVILFGLLTLAFMLLLNLGRGFLSQRAPRRPWRRRPPGFGGRGPFPNNGDGGAGVREPRRPFPPDMPPRAIHLDPDGAVVP